ncbi:hypothetical protein C2U70_21815 [Bradyrhizobium guangdongense]|uniref:hypothetical protein n=1 Tax=Bradyrhizobium guangdongense TaxID=1325090 RepID=UPI00112EF1B5|nr:hypothetical protein [Bradyrhizobium guangdongense]TPQ32363.1 hypothetical protein C2U70_21815 [Bradyrhizobium guangdongense]
MIDDVSFSHRLLPGSLWLQTAILAALLLLGSSVVESAAKTRRVKDQTTETWAWSQIKSGNAVDFNSRCRTPNLESHSRDEANDTLWKNECRTIRASFLVDLLTRAQYANGMKPRGVELIGARIVGDVGLQSARIKQAVLVRGGRVEGDVDLTGARIESLFGVTESRITGSFFGSNLESTASLALGDNDFEKSVLLDSAKVAANVDLSGAIVAEVLNADTIQVGSHFVLSGSELRRAKFNYVNLAGARINGNIRCEGTTVTGEFDANSAQVGASLIMGSPDNLQTQFETIRIDGARIAGHVLLSGATINGTLNAEVIQVGGDFLLGATNTRGAEFRDVVLRSGRIAGGLVFAGTPTDATLYADHMQIGADMSIISPPWAPPVRFKAVNLRSARIAAEIVLNAIQVDETFDASSMQLGSHLIVGPGSVLAQLELNSSKIGGNLEFSGVTLSGSLNADAIEVGAHVRMVSNALRQTTLKRANLALAKVVGDLDARGTTFQSLDVSGATISGNVILESANFEEDVIADSAQIGARFLMSSDKSRETSVRSISLTNARVAGYVDLSGVGLRGDIDLTLIQAGSHLALNSTHVPILNSTFLGGAKIAGNLNIANSASIGSLLAASMQVGGDVLILGSQVADLNVTGAKVAGQLAMDNSTLRGRMAANTVDVGGSVSLRGIKSRLSIGLISSRIASNLDVKRAKLARLDLSGTTIGGDFRLGGNQDSVIWEDPYSDSGDLVLRDTRVTNLVDARDAWPKTKHLHLDGFSFSHLGGFGASGSSTNEEKRDSKWWDEWAKRDPNYSTMPYEQLALAMSAAGDRGAADDMRFFNRRRQHETEKSWWPWIGSGFVQYTTGYGIGDYTWRVLFCVAFISAIGATYLRLYVPNARSHGLTWCVFATVSRLLPIIEINKEFTEFFEDPHRKNLTRREMFAFSLIGIAGWLLGAMLIAAVSGLTQKGG